MRAVYKNDGLIPTMIIPGLGDNVKPMSWATKFWTRFGLNPIVHNMEWEKNTSFEDKFGKLLNHIDETGNNHKRLFLVGTSAGASAAINAWEKRKQKIAKVVSICGRLRTGNNHSGKHKISYWEKDHPDFVRSVIKCETVINQLTENEKQKFLTLNAWGWDELVPDDTSMILGIKNIRIPIPGHVTAISTAVTAYFPKIADFLNSK